MKKTIRKPERLRTLQRTFELHAPVPVDSVIRCDVVTANSPDHELLLEAGSEPDLFTRSADQVLSLSSVDVPGGHQICSYDGGTPSQPLFAMHQNRTSYGNGLVDEVARDREVNKDIRVVLVFDRNPQPLDPASGNIRWNGVRADGHDMSDPPLRYGSGSASGDQVSKQELMLVDRVNVLPTHRLACVGKGLGGRNVQEGEE